jgi:virginiamycin A acetyltransferase
VIVRKGALLGTINEERPVRDNAAPKKGVTPMPNYGPDPEAIYPNPQIKQICFIKNVITRPNIMVGDYSYYDDKDEAERFEERVTHHYEFIGDKLVIGRFCAIARGVEFIMNGANHRMGSVTTYPFNIMGGGWEKAVPSSAGCAHR